MKHTFSTGLHSDTSFFQTWFDARHEKDLLFDFSLNDLDLHSRSQGCMKAGTCAGTSSSFHAAQAFALDDYVREIAATQSCKHVDYGSFEHSLFLINYWYAQQGKVGLELALIILVEVRK